MKNIMQNEEADIYNCDVLVIGGGLAGSWAAIKAKELVDNVVLVDKAKVARSGCSTFAAGVMLAPRPDDDLEVWMKELVERGEYLNDQEWVEIVLKEQPALIEMLDKWGVPFEKDENGRVARTIGRGHEYTRILMFHGPKFMRVMRQQLLHRKVRLVERVMVTDLLTSDSKHPTKGMINGAIGFHCRSGKLQVFNAKSVVLSAGGVWGKARAFTGNLTGDGLAMSFRSGAEMHGMEYTHTQSGWFFERRFNAQGLNMFQSNGARFVNGLGEAFMEKYDPKLKERARVDELCLIFAKEGVEGRGPIYMDMTHFSKETWEKIRRVVPTGMRVFDESGIDPRKQKMRFDIGAGAVSNRAGGIKHNIYCETNLPGLYTAGQEGGYPPHGNFAVGGLNLATCCVGGRRAGEYAALFSRHRGQPDVALDQVEELREAAFSPLYVKEGITANEINVKIAELIHLAPVSFFRHENRIRATLKRLEEIRGMLTRLSASDCHELVKANEMKNYLQCIELMNMSALERKESRGSLNREDYPYRDDINWLKRIVLRLQENGGIDTRLEPIPIYRYPIRPEKLEKIPARIPAPKIDWGEV